MSLISIFSYCFHFQCVLPSLDLLRPLDVVTYPREKLRLKASRTHQTRQGPTKQAREQPDQALGFRTGYQALWIRKSPAWHSPPKEQMPGLHTRLHFLKVDTASLWPTHAWLLCMEMMSLLDSLLQHMAQTKIPGCLTASQSKWDSRSFRV